jgi:hypothetical protein
MTQDNEMYSYYYDVFTYNLIYHKLLRWHIIRGILDEQRGRCAPLIVF